MRTDRLKPLRSRPRDRSPCRLNPARSSRSISPRSPPTGARCAARHAPGAVAGVVKADGYGLGAAPRRARAVRRGMPALLRRATGRGAGDPPARAGRDGRGAERAAAGRRGGYTSHAGIDPVLGSLDEVDRWAAQARRVGRTLPALLHIDTGHGAARPRSARSSRALQHDHARLDGIELRYVMTHLVSAELPDDPVNAVQRERFAARLRRSACRAAQLRQFVRASSSARRSPPTSRGPARHSTASTRRRGAAEPDAARGARCARRVLQVRDIGPGETRRLQRDLAGGAAEPDRDGRRSAMPMAGIAHSPDAGQALFDGEPVPLVGRVSMDLTTFDVTDLPAIGPGRLARADRTGARRSTRCAEAAAPTATRS